MKHYTSRLIVFILLVLSGNSAKAQEGGTGCCIDLADLAACGKNYVLIENAYLPESGIALQSSNIIQVELDSYSTYQSSPTVLFQVTTNILDQNYFNLISDHISTGDQTTSTWSLYEVLNPYPNAIPGTYYSLSAKNLDPSWYSPHYYNISGKNKVNIQCSSCLSPVELNAFFDKLYKDFFGPHYHGQAVPYTTVTAFNSLNPDQQDAIAYFIGKYFMNLSTLSGFTQYLGTSTNFQDNFNISNYSTACVDGLSQVSQCPCMSQISQLYVGLIPMLNADWNFRSQVLTYLNNYRDSHSDCAADYCYYVSYSSSQLTVHAIPFGNVNAPLIAFQVDHSSSGTTGGIAISYSYSGSPGNLWTYNFIPSNAIQMQSNSYVAGNSFSILDEQYFNTTCSIQCKNCIPSFDPSPDSEYVLTAWAREESFVGLSSFSSPKIYIDFICSSTCPTALPPFTVSGNIIDGWQRIEGKFIVPHSGIKFTLRLECESGDCYFDDIRIFPSGGSMKTYVYDPVTLRLSAILDEEHFATFYEYDEDGNLIRVKKETERGIMTIQENKSSLIKTY